MSKNILIVESENDKYFIEAFINYLNLKNIEVDTPICRIDDYECLAGKDNLTRRLNELKPEIGKDGSDKVGIILDADEEGIEKKIKGINKCLKNNQLDIVFTGVNNLIPSTILDVEMACYIINVDKKGELETLLKTIKSKPSPYADCLEAWRECLTAQGESIKDKSFDKFWVSIYKRFDTCTEEEQKQAHKNCAGEVSMKKDIWDFEHDNLTDLKTFLQLFA